MQSPGQRNNARTLALFRAGRPDIVEAGDRSIEPRQGGRSDKSDQDSARAGGYSTVFPRGPGC
eukprot:1189341-Prorocentrum_minimum.AAC.6